VSSWPTIVALIALISEVKRYYLVDARSRVEAAINSLPQPDEPDATERFGEGASCVPCPGKFPDAGISSYK